MESPGQTLQLIARFFDLGKIERFSSAAGAANDNYFVETNSGRYVAKILKEHTADSARSELPFLHRLKEHDFPAACYLQSPCGSFVFENSVFERDIAAVVMDAATGSTFETVDTKTIRTLGEVLARLHSVPADNLKARPHWFSTSFVQQSLKELTAAVGDCEVEPYKTAFDSVGDIGNPDIRQSIVHGDYHQGNCLFDQGKLTAVIDWEEVSHGPSLLDIAFTTIAACHDFERSAFDSNRFLALMDGYQGVRPLLREERAHLPLFVRYIGLVISTWAYLRYGIDNTDPDIIAWRKMYWELDLDNWTVPEQSA